MKKFKKGKCYFYNDIEKQVLASWGNTEYLDDIGGSTIGNNFLVVHDTETSSTCSFVLSGSNGNNGYSFILYITRLYIM
jgi:hypothetical protein